MNPSSSPDDVEIVDRISYLEVRYLGEFSVTRFNRQTDAAVQACSERGLFLLLIDLTGLNPIPTVIERFEAAIHGAKVAAELSRVALVARPEFIDPGKFGVQVARNRGLNAEIFTDCRKALEWLQASEKG